MYIAYQLDQPMTATARARRVICRGCCRSRPSIRRVLRAITSINNRSGSTTSTSNILPPRRRHRRFIVGLLAIVMYSPRGCIWAKVVVGWQLFWRTHRCKHFPIRSVNMSLLQLISLYSLNYEKSLFTFTMWSLSLSRLFVQQYTITLLTDYDRSYSSYDVLYNLSI